MAREANLERERAVGFYKELAPPENYAKAKLGAPPPWWKGGDAERAKYAEAVRICKRFAAGYGILAMLGPRGTGKSYLGWATLIEACRLGQSAKYVKAHRLFMNIKDVFGQREKTVGATVDALIKPKKLLVDELGEIRLGDDFDQRQLIYLIDERYDRKLGTILMSNDTPETFLGKIGPSVKSRIDERGKILIFTWPTFRDGHENAKAWAEDAS